MGVFGALAGAWTYVLAHQGSFVDALTRHLELVFVSEVVAVLVAVPLGILATRDDRARNVIETGGNVAQTVPTLAIIALMLPLLGIGFVPAVVGLFVYALLPVLTNTIAGIEGVDADTVEAARGMGMTEWGILRTIQLPLALPVIFAGIRTSTVLNVGTAYLAFFISAGGLGDWVIPGIQLFNTSQLLAGAITGALLAIVLDGVLALIERRLGTESSASQATAAAG